MTNPDDKTDDYDLKIQKDFITATTLCVHSITVMHNGVKLRIDDNGGLNDNRAVKTQIMVNFNNKMCSDSLEYILPIFVSSSNAFDSGMDLLIKHLNVFSAQFKDVSLLKNHVQMIVTKTTKARKKESILKKMKEGFIDINNHQLSEPAR